MEESLFLLLGRGLVRFSGVHNLHIVGAVEFTDSRIDEQRGYSFNLL
jgi:hypothetical protein